MIKAESEHAEAEAGVAAFLTKKFTPAIRRTMQLREEEIAGVRIAARPSQARINVHENIVYNALGKRALLLDLYTPKTVSATRLPVVLFVHGGGWLNGTHRSNRPVAMSLAQKGFACVALEYRLFHMLEKKRCLPLLFVKGVGPLSAWIQSHIPESRSRHVHFRWPHAFECFDPSKDDLVDILAEYLKPPGKGSATHRLPATSPGP